MSGAPLMTWADAARTMATMQPTMITSSSTPLARASRRRRRAAIVAGATALALSSLLTACGGSSDASTSSSNGSDATTTAAGSNTGDTSGDQTTTTAVAGAPDLDLCAKITKEDMAAILPEATLTTVEPNSAIPAPSCRYQIDISGGGVSMQSDVISIVWNEPGFFDAQQELQTDEQAVPGVGADAFSIDDGGQILVRGKTGAFQITRGVELTSGGTAASDEQMAAIAKLVADL